MKAKQAHAASVLPDDIKSIADLPLKSDYRVLLWYGQANGNLLTPGFNITDLINRTIVLKSIRIVPYYEATGAIDFNVTDGAADWSEVLGSGLVRIDRLFDAYAQSSTRIRCIINNSLSGLFNNLNATTGYPLDMWLDNIFYKFDAKIQSWDFRVNSQVLIDVEAGTFDEPLVKVVCECYII